MIDLVRDEAFQPGDRLPTVAAMAQRFGVAQPTMRESLRLLQAVNIVEIRHGSGIYLKRGTAALVLPNPYPGELTSAVLLDLFDTRLLIEPRIATLATHHASDSDISSLMAILQEASVQLDYGDDQALNRLNMEFHRRLADYSGSPLLAQIMDSLVGLYASEQLAVMRLYDNRAEDLEQHQGIMTAISSRDAQLAQERMFSHLTLVRHTVATRLAEQDRHSGRLDSDTSYATRKEVSTTSRTQ